MWADLNPDVLYDPDINLREATSRYNIRYYNHKKYVTNTTNIIDKEHAHNSNSENDDQRSEAQ